MLKHLGDEAARLRPDVFVAIDFPDFNFRLLPVMKKLGIPVVYYVSPQLWAWREGRIETLKKHVGRMLVIFPFETEMYQKAGVPWNSSDTPWSTSPCRRETDWMCSAPAGLDSLRPVVALLPGSRRNELTENPAHAGGSRGADLEKKCRASSFWSPARRRSTTPLRTADETSAGGAARGDSE
jgi:lipid-A-disaccharide synthase